MADEGKGLLFVVSGPSGVGKGTICRRLIERRPEIKVSVSCATRAPREGEVDGVHYFFVSDDRFAEMIENGELLEHARVHGNQYGTPRQYVEQMLDAGHDVILEIDVQGGRQILAAQVEMTGVFVLPPSYEELVNRLIHRGTESESQIRLRLKNSADEFLAAEDYDYLLTNAQIEEAVDQLEAVIRAQHLTRAHNIDRLHTLHEQIKEGKTHDD